MNIRVNGTQSSEIFPNSPTTPRGTVDFSQVFTQTQVIQSQEFEEFIKRLDKKGKQLSESLSLRSLIEFKDMVQTFLKSTFGQSRKITDNIFWDGRGKSKILSRITEIDKALEDLGKQMLANQLKPLEILIKIDEIKGLIIDLWG